MKEVMGMHLPSRRAVCLLSGGLDSTTCLAVARHQGFECYALSFDYGQRHQTELAAAGKVAASLGAARHVTLKLDLRAFGGSALTDEIAVPKHARVEDIGEGIPVTYVPARNTIFLSCALGWAEVLGAFDIFLGVNAVDYSGYPDCRPDFIRSFEETARLATAAGVEGKGSFRIHTPLIDLTKAEIIGLAASLNVDLSLTHSCYDPSPTGKSCGRCDSCLLRRKGFAEAGLTDPLEYVA
jgi:7-cyano-7-deazaguanine synthase